MANINKVDNLDKKIWWSNKSDHISYFQKNITDELNHKEYNKHNYYQNTSAIYQSCVAPSREPNFISDSGTNYRYEDSGVVRASDHRGRVWSNLWYIEYDKHIVPDSEDHQVFLDRMECGYCLWEDFLQWPSEFIIRPIPDYLISKKVLEYGDKVYVGKDFYDIRHLPDGWMNDHDVYDQVEQQGVVLETVDKLKQQFYDFNEDVEFESYPTYLKIKRKLLEARKKSKN